MGHDWADFLHQPAASAHGVQVYAELGELAGPVAEYFVAGFDAGRPGLVVATPALLAELAVRFDAAGWGAKRLDEAGLLTTADPETTLARFMENGQLSAAMFFDAVGRELDALERRFPAAPARVFGEIVDLLCRREESDAAAELERLWNALARARGFALYCAYRLDVFDRDVQTGALRSVCDAHSHVLPAAEPARFAEAVDQALAETLGPTGAGHVYAVVGRQIRRDRVPAAQLVLMWVSENMPLLADRILASARDYYFATPLQTAR
jgi:hypothetical protein